MSKSLQTTSSSALAELTANVNVGMDEVVSVFVSKWEKELFARKKELSDKIKQIKDDIKIHETRLINSVDTDKYEMKIDVINIVSKVEGVTLTWADPEEDRRNRDKNEIIVSVEISDPNSTDSWRSTLDKRFVTPINKKDVKVHQGLVDELKDTNGELIEVMGHIKSVSRKEREIRGEIAARKIAESGLSELLEDASMLQLVQLD